MIKRITDAVVVHCIDFRLQKYLDPWLQKRFGYENYNRVALAGGVFDFDTISKQVEISNRLHKIKKVVLINHEDCGAYGIAGTFERHKQDLMKARHKISTQFPNLDVEMYYLLLDGTFEQV
jgi:carbonic anhydrase